MINQKSDPTGYKVSTSSLNSNVSASTSKIFPFSVIKVDDNKYFPTNFTYIEMLSIQYEVALFLIAKLND